MGVMIMLQVIIKITPSKPTILILHVYKIVCYIAGNAFGQDEANPVF